MIWKQEQIIRNAETLERSVDLAVLERYTTKQTLETLPESWRKKARLEELHILGCQEMPMGDGSFQCYTDPQGKWMLISNPPKTFSLSSFPLPLAKLLKLDIRFSTMTELNLADMPSLTSLNLAQNDALRVVESWDQADKLTALDLHQTQLDNLDGIGELISLQTLDLSGLVLDAPWFLSKLVNLKTLWLIDCTIGHFPSLEKLTDLRKLYLTGAVLPDAMKAEFPSSLQVLNLAYSSVCWLPEELSVLRNLQCLDLSGLTFRELPNWLAELGLKFSQRPGIGIVLMDTVFEGIDMSIFEQPYEVILQWFRERRKPDRLVELNEVKVVFLGDGGVGKSHIISRLLADGNQPMDSIGESSPGIVISNKEYVIDKRKILVHFWDFGGQEILHSMHRLFLTERTMYVVVLSARDDTPNERARYWLHNVRSFAGNAPVLLVLNQMDQNLGASLDETELRQIAPAITEIVMLSAQYDSREAFNTQFTASLLGQINRMGNLNYQFPVSWNRIKQKLESMESPYIRGTQYAEICKSSGVDDTSTQRSLLNWFNDLGVSFCYGGAKMDDYVILRPDWLTNAIYMLLYNKLENARNGIVSLQTIYEVLAPKTGERNRIRSVLPNVTYTREETTFVINVLRRFRMSYPISEHEEFIPMLCDAHISPAAAEYEHDPATLEFRMVYEYLPNNVIHRLMLDLHDDLDMDHIWRTGARFVQNSTGLSAVVVGEGDELRIYVRSTHERCPVYHYLDVIRKTVDQINADMGLTRPARFIIYKVGSLAERFNYDELIHALGDGKTSWFSQIRGREIPISEILHQAAPDDGMAREQLVRDVITACRSMQSKKYYWNLPDDEKIPKEHVRNGYIRDSLRNMNYQVYDQTLQGMSGGFPKAGELDLEIRRSADTPWTMLEAVTVKGADLKEKRRWESHLDILLNHYNPHGLGMLFLVSYIECGKEAFSQIAAAYDEHMCQHNPQHWLRDSDSFEYLPVEDTGYIRAAKCTYDCSGTRVTVYHFMVHLGIDQTLEEKEAAMLNEPAEELKVVFLGDGEAGKSLTVARLHDPNLDVRKFDGDVTPGIDIKSREYEIMKRKVRVNFWDFGGQEILHSMHRLFLSERTLYVIILNTRNDSQDERAEFWLRYVNTFAPDAPVILVLNKIDQNLHASINQTVLRRDYPNLKTVLRISAWTASVKEFQKDFIEPLEEQIYALQVQETALLDSGIRVREELRRMPLAKMTKESYEKLCEEQGVSDATALLKQLERAGVCVCFHGSRYAEQYMLLKPEWITNAIYIILFNLHSQAQNGVISHEKIYELFDRKRTDILRVLDTKYKKRDIKYILEVLRTYRLSFEIEEGKKEFLPMLCPRNELSEGMEDFRQGDCLEFHMCFDYLPADVLYQIMVARRDEVNTDQPRIWLTGAILDRPNGCSAAIIKENNILKFYVSQKKGMIYARDYMSALRHDVEQIVRKQKLRITENRMVYKFDGKEECFDYDRLLLSQQHGVLNMVSKNHQQAISVQSILDQTFRSEEVMYESLLKSVIWACQIMQDNMDYWDKKEPVLNRHLRDLLRGMQYTVMDQPEKGASATWKSSGRPDMIVMLPERNADVILEVVKINGINKADVNDWEKHMKKLTDNYNTTGHKMMILLTYLNCRQADLEEADDFYFDLISKHGPAACGGRPEQCERLPWDDCPPFIRITRCEYYSKGYCPTVYHFLVYFPKNGIEKTAES